MTVIIFCCFFLTLCRFWGGYEWEEIFLAGNPQKFCCDWKGMVSDHVLRFTVIESDLGNVSNKTFLILKGIAKLPFIDEERLLAEIKKVEHTLTVSNRSCENIFLLNQKWKFLLFLFTSLSNINVLFCF